jgi:chromosomal replication initiator protein
MPILTKEAPSTAAAEVATIKRMVAKEFEVDVSEIESDTRVVPIPMIRHVAMYMVRRLIPEGSASLMFVARSFNREHYGTIIHAVRNVEAQRDVDPKFKRKVDALRLRIRDVIGAKGSS